MTTMGVETGDVVTEEVARALPYGSLVKDGARDTYRKIGDMSFEIVDYSDDQQTLDFGALDHPVVAHLASEEPPHVGDTIHRLGDLLACPDETEFINHRATVNNRAITFHSRHGMLHNSNGGRHELTSTRMDHFLMVQRIGPVHTVNEEVSETEVIEAVEEEPEWSVMQPVVTLVEFKQMLRTIALGNATSNSIPIEPVERALTKIECGPSTPMAGMWLHRHDPEMPNQLPQGTTLLLGRRTDKAAAFRLDGWENGDWTLLTGQSTMHYGVDPGRIIKMPGVGRIDWPSAITEEQVREVVEFRQQVWDVGYAAKLDNSWCGVFERTMRVVGAGENMPAILGIDEVRALPEGTLLRVACARDGGLVVRDDRADNPSATRGLSGSGHWGWLFERHNDHILLRDVAEVMDLPVGSRLRDYSGSYHFTKQEDDTWLQDVRAVRRDSTAILDHLGMAYLVSVPS
jgi:hypothetical protein